MKNLLLISAAGAALLLAGCASEGGYYGGAAVGYDYYGPSDAWYDGYYGPYVDGYWGDGGVFFYSTGRGDYRRDEGGHFRNREFDGGARVHVSPRHR